MSVCVRLLKAAFQPLPPPVSRLLEPSTQHTAATLTANWRFTVRSEDSRPSTATTVTETVRAQMQGRAHHTFASMPFGQRQACHLLRPLSLNLLISDALAPPQRIVGGTLHARATALIFTERSTTATATSTTTTNRLISPATQTTVSAVVLCSAFLAMLHWFDSASPKRLPSFFFFFCASLKICRLWLLFITTVQVCVC